MGHEAMMPVYLKIDAILVSTSLTAVPHLDVNDHKNIATPPQWLG
jgi:hypothetical protein